MITLNGQHSTTEHHRNCQCFNQTIFIVSQLTPVTARLAFLYSLFFSFFFRLQYDESLSENFFADKICSNANELNWPIAQRDYFSHMSIVDFNKLSSFSSSQIKSILISVSFFFSIAVAHDMYITIHWRFLEFQSFFSSLTFLFKFSITRAYVAKKKYCKNFCSSLFKRVWIIYVNFVLFLALNTWHSVIGVLRFKCFDFCDLVPVHWMKIF